MINDAHWLQCWPDEFSQNIKEKLNICQIFYMSFMQVMPIGQVWFLLCVNIMVLMIGWYNLWTRSDWSHSPKAIGIQ